MERAANRIRAKVTPKDYRFELVFPPIVIPRLDRGISRGTVLEQIPRTGRGMTVEGARRRIG